MFRRACKRLLTPPLVVLAALVMFVEEWLWDRMVAATAWVGRLPAVQKIETKLAALPRYAALLVLLVPGVLLFPIKLAALYFIAKGHVIAGISVILAAKVLGTAFVARMFTVCRPALMSIDWLRQLTEWLVSTKNRLYARLKRMAAWQRAIQFVQQIRHFLARFRGEGLRRRWQAIKRWRKRRLPPAATPSGTPSDPL